MTEKCGVKPVDKWTFLVITLSRRHREVLDCEQHETVHRRDCADNAAEYINKSVFSFVRQPTT